MGSGHFLVSLVDWLADHVLDAMAEASASVGFAPYVSPLASRIEAIRARILAEAKTHGWPIAGSQLDDRHIVRRMVLKRVVYGVDKNPMAVELAKVALWLHSFTVGAPLSFLDHHLRCGDSILGAWTRRTVDRAAARVARCSTRARSRASNMVASRDGEHRGDDRQRHRRGDGVQGCIRRRRRDDRADRARCSRWSPPNT